MSRGCCGVDYGRHLGVEAASNAQCWQAIAPIGCGRGSMSANSSGYQWIQEGLPIDYWISSVL